MSLSKFEICVSHWTISMSWHRNSYKNPFNDCQKYEGTSKIIRTSFTFLFTVPLPSTYVYYCAHVTEVSTRTRYFPLWFYNVRMAASKCTKEEQRAVIQETVTVKRLSSFDVIESSRQWWELMGVLLLFALHTCEATFELLVLLIYTPMR